MFAFSSAMTADNRIPSTRKAVSALRLAGRRFVVLTMAAVLLFGQTTGAFAAGLIRDSEIEDLISDYATPIFRAAGISAQNVHIHLVSDQAFNAFVIDGQNMFVHVGAIMKADTPNQLIGVLAHEAGHIAGGHLARLKVQIGRMQSAALIMNILGLGAMIGGAVAGGGNDVGEAGAAVLHGGSSLITRSLLSYRRVEESSADQAAVSYLNQTKQSAAGMLRTFRFFADQSLGSATIIDPYIQSHPMPQDRIAQLRNLAERSPYFNAKDSPELQFRHDLVRAKLMGFMNKSNASLVMRKYPEKDQSLPARYARAISRYYSGGSRNAIGDIDGLIAEQPNNAYFHELKGQFLLEGGNVTAAIEPLRKAVALKPDAGLMRIMLAQAQIASNDPALLKEAVVNLKRGLAKENRSALGYRQLAQAYGRMNKIAEADLASAQASFFEGNAEHAKIQAERAMHAFPEGSPDWVKANDIVDDIATYKKLARRN
jgi:predicted Zn-dependent protease